MFEKAQKSLKIFTDLHMAKKNPLTQKSYELAQFLYRTNQQLHLGGIGYFIVVFVIF